MIKNSKLQISNHKKIPMSNDQNSKQNEFGTLEFGKLELVWNLVLGA
ncbi:MAG: hypothetical protein M0R20_01300 [Candidatus Omnitrophica bacterium]|jgi:hypothetical protein|nr:hypothetical protein [Candidatus Omnitrophota bacterium]